MWVPSTEEASRYGLPSLLLHSPLLHALCPPRCLERSFRRCPHLTSAPPCLSSQEVSSKRLWSPSRALAESSHPAEKPPPVAPLCPGTVPAWDFIVPVAQGGGCAALGTPDSAALGTPQRPGCASPRMLPPAALLPWVPALLLLLPLLPPLPPWKIPSSAGMGSHSRARCQRPGGARATKSRATAKLVQQSLGRGLPLEQDRSSSPAPCSGLSLPHQSSPTAECRFHSHQGKTHIDRPGGLQMGLY